MRTLHKLVLITTLATALPAQSGSEARMRQNHAILQRIEQAAPGEHLAALQAGLDSIPYRLQDPEEYARMVSSAFNALYLKDNRGSVEVRQAEQWYVLLALERPEQLPAEIELLLVMRLRANIDPTTDPPDRKDVLRKQLLLFHAWHRMEKETDPDFKLDLLDLPHENVCPPLGAGPNTAVFCGMDPSFIADPKLRQAYLDAIEKNRALIARVNLQGFLRDNNERFVRHAQTFLLAAIQTGATTEEEVVSELKSVSDTSARDRVLAKLRSVKAP